jgi:hypothetical protein
MFEISIFLRDKLIGRSTFSLEEVRIGRSADNEVRIDNPALSRYHASIESVAGIYLLKDFGSQNGTFVNGERVAGRRGLQDGDKVQIGKFTLVFRTEKQVAVDHAEVRDQASYAVAGETMILRTQPDAKDRTCPFVGYLEEIVPAGPIAPNRHPLARDFFLIGSTAAAQLVLDKGASPDRAAVIVRGWQGFGIVSLAPGHVKRNGEPVDFSSLSEGDALQVGTAAYIFHMGRPDVSF